MTIPQPLDLPSLPWRMSACIDVHNNIIVVCEEWREKNVEGGKRALVMSEIR